MATTPSARSEAGAPGLRAETFCEAFHLTAASRAGEVALRTPEGATEITWGEYADRARNVAAGLASLGVGRGDTVALMLTNRPEFHVADCGAMHLGATTFSVYNTSSPEQVEYLLSDAANRVIVTERAFVDRVQAARGATAVEHVVLVDGEAGGADEMTLAELEVRGDPRFDFEAAWRAVQPEDVLTLIY